MAAANYSAAPGVSRLGLFASGVHPVATKKMRRESEAMPILTNIPNIRGGVAFWRIKEEEDDCISEDLGLITASVESVKDEGPVLQAVIDICDHGLITELAA